ncbi:MAG: LPS assembly protein LptD [Candidatus Omnitrophota bacterium]
MFKIKYQKSNIKIIYENSKSCILHCNFNFYILIFAFFCSLLFYKIIYAEEKAGPIEVNGDEVEYLFSEKKVVGKGNINIDYNDISLRCDSIVVHTDTKDVLAEGNVVLTSPTSEMKGERVKYNFETKEGEIIDARVRSGEWYSGGDEGRLLPDGSISIKEGYITSCDLEEPHYKISSKKVTITPDNQVVAKNVVFKAGNIPVFYLPRYNYSLDADWPTVNVIPGRKKEWGAFALTSYRYDLDEDLRATLFIDERENWGLGEGIDLKYNSQDLGKGLIRTYYTNQRDRDRNEAGTRREEERYRVQIRHLWDIEDNLTMVSEIHRYSDQDMTKDFFYREEYERESSPESYLYLLNRESEYSLSFLARKRINRFQSATERLPEVRFDLKDQELLGLPVYFKTDSTVSSLNSKTANTGVDSDTIRLDTLNKLSSPLRIANIFSFAPFVGARNTFYSRDNSGTSRDDIRTAFTTGVDLSAKFMKTFDAAGKFFGIELNKLHHIITPTIEYEYMHEPSITSSDLQQFDDIDSISKKNNFGLGLQNRFQTKREIDGKLKTVDLGYLLLTGDYAYKPEDGSRFQTVKADLEFTPLDGFMLESDTAYNPSTRDFEDWNLDLFIDKKEDTRFGFGSRYWQDTEHELTSELLQKLNNAWSVRLFARFDLKEVESNGHKIINRFDTRGISIIKDLHCWVAEVSLDSGRGGEITAWCSFKLKASPKVPFDFKDYYAIPKVH